MPVIASPLPLKIVSFVNALILPPPILILEPAIRIKNNIY